MTEVSATTQAIIDLLKQRDAAGRAKYGTTLDRTDLSHAEWLQHMAEELLDAAGYALAAKRKGEVQEAQHMPRDWLNVMAALVSHIERETCPHEETHRGGFLWEICDSCGAKWADDEGGKPEFAWPACVEHARALLAATSEPPK